ncbi:MAG: ATP-binding cassette domain-containing protein [Thermodesulfobacteriota bacterium]
MNELWRRLMLRPKAALELLAATACINVLSFASPLFVMLILSEYINSGFTRTLVTLSLGMTLALLLQMVFKEVRTMQAGAVGAAPDRELAERLFAVLARARVGILERIPAARRSELLGHVSAVQAAYAASNLNAVMDGPFALLFIAAAWWLSPVLACIGLAGLAAALLYGVMAQKNLRADLRTSLEASAACRGVLFQAASGADTLRAFGGARHLGRLWSGHAADLLRSQQALAGQRGQGQAMTVLLYVLTRVLFYAVGAKLCVAGELSMAGLIVGNILVSRAMRQAQGLSAALAQFASARQPLAELAEFFRLPLEPEAGTALRRFSGRVEMRDVAFAFPGSSGPLFESLHLALEPGTVLAVTGPNGSGKTTLARLAAGLLEPTRGEILADGINLRQMAPAWWRQQVQYAPQEPVLLNGTLAENIRMANPDLPDAALAHIIRAVGLERCLASAPRGLDTPVADGGRSLSLGVRRRLALARALATGGNLVILDEPTEGLDADGTKAVHALLHEMASLGRTVIVITLDPAILRSVHAVLNLGVKPRPELTVRRPAPAPAPGPTETSNAPRH